MMKNQEKYNVIKEMVSEGLPILTDLGYKLEKIQINKNSAREHEVLTFENNKLSIEINFYPGNDKKNETDLFSVYINSGEKYMSCLLYLKHHELLQDKNYFNLNAYEGVFENKITDFLNFLNFVFHEYMQSILKGEKWEDIPTYWGGYR